MRGQTSRFILSDAKQRTLRRAATDAERLLWRHLRARRLGGYKFRRQHPYDDHILDFVCLEAGLVVEADGGQHAESRRDRRRDADLAIAGFTVLRFWDNDILTRTADVVDSILRTLEDLGVEPSSPRPSP
jgi:very-short-patch-repair endonuclease